MRSKNTYHRRQSKYLKIYLFDCLWSVQPRETREGWLLLTVETEANGDSTCTNERGPPWLVRWALKKRLSCLVCSGQASTKYFFPHHTLFQSICPHLPASWARQSCRVACLLMRVSGPTSGNFPFFLLLSNLLILYSILYEGASPNTRHLFVTPGGIFFYIIHIRRI